MGRNAESIKQSSTLYMEYRHGFFMSSWLDTGDVGRVFSSPSIHLDIMYLK